MAEASSTKQMEKSIERYFERYSTKRIALAAFVVGVLTIGLTYVSYAMTAHMLIATLVFAVVGFLSVNLSMIFIVPPSEKLEKSRELIFMALRDSSRIKASDGKKVKIVDKVGTIHSLKGVDLAVWNSHVLPHLMQQQGDGSSGVKLNTDRKLTVSERKYIEGLHREVKTIEKKIAKERRALDALRWEVDEKIEKLRGLDPNYSGQTQDIPRVEVDVEPIADLDMPGEPEGKKESDKDSTAS